MKSEDVKGLRDLAVLLAEEIAELKRRVDRLEREKSAPKTSGRGGNCKCS